MDLGNYQTKMKVDRGGVSYHLLTMVENGRLPESSVANLVATDLDDKIIWIAEPPATNHDCYWKIYFDGERLMALSGIGELHEIDKDSGKVLNHKMIK